MENFRNLPRVKTSTMATSVDHVTASEALRNMHLSERLLLLKHHVAHALQRGSIKADGVALVSCNACTERRSGRLSYHKASKAFRHLQGVSIQLAIPTARCPLAKKKKKALRKTRWRQVRYLLQPFLSYAFVCIYLEQRRHKANNKGKDRTEQDTKWGWDSVVRAKGGPYLCPHPHGNPFLGDSAQVRKWHASQVWINSKLFLHAAEDCS